MVERGGDGGCGWGGWGHKSRALEDNLLIHQRSAEPWGYGGWGGHGGGGWGGWGRKCRSSDVITTIEENEGEMIENMLADRSKRSAEP